MTSFDIIDSALLAHVSGGDQTTDGQCQRAADDQYHSFVQRSSGTAATGQNEHDILEQAFKDSRGRLDRCKTRANAAVGVGLTPDMLNFDQLAK